MSHQSRTSNSATIENPLLEQSQTNDSNENPPTTILNPNITMDNNGSTETSMCQLPSTQHSTDYLEEPQMEPLTNGSYESLISLSYMVSPSEEMAMRQEDRQRTDICPSSSSRNQRRTFNASQEPVPNANMFASSASHCRNRSEQYGQPISHENRTHMQKRYHPHIPHHRSTPSTNLTHTPGEHRPNPFQNTPHPRSILRHPSTLDNRNLSSHEVSIARSDNYKPLVSIAEAHTLVHPPTEQEDEEEEEEETPLKPVMPSERELNRTPASNTSLRHISHITDDSIRDRNAFQNEESLQSLNYNINQEPLPAPDHTHLLSIRNSLLPNDLLEPAERLDKFQVTEVLNK